MYRLLLLSTAAPDRPLAATKVSVGNDVQRLSAPRPWTSPGATPLLQAALVKSGWPNTRSAGAPFVNDFAFSHPRTRLLKLSTTYRCPAASTMSADGFENESASVPYHPL